MMQGDRVLFGAAYYNEYHHQDQLDRDLDLMVKANFTVIRVGESVWSTWEPENGKFDLDWMQPILDGAHKRGISVILGTPTYAVPPWLVRLYPEIAGERQTGERIGWGARQEVDYTHPAFKFHAERVCRAILARFAKHPAVIGFQVDNEPGLELFHNEGVFQRFVDSLRHQYGTVEKLNKEWGLVYWSHNLSTWADLWRPDGNAQPQYDVAWRRFQAEQTTEFVAWQAAITREYARPDQFVTTCIAYDRPAIDDAAVTRALDVNAGNPYYTMQEGLQLPDDRIILQYWSSTGVWALFSSADRMWSSKQAPFLVTETNAGFIGFPWNNRPAYDGQWRQAAWALVARGAKLIEYWHWHTLHFGAETYWGGILPHSGEPGRVYRELAQLGSDFAKAGDLVAGMTPQADVAFLYSSYDKWLMQKYPALADQNGGPDARAYQGLYEPFYRGAFDAGLGARYVHVSQVVGSDALGELRDPKAFAKTVKTLVVVGTYLCPDELIGWLRAYVEAGGHLILGPRSLYADPEGRARPAIMPFGLTDLAGASYDEFSNLSVEVPLSAGDWAGGGTRWLDGLEASGAEVLAGYDHPHFSKWAAVTTKQAGAGRVTMVGTVPSVAMARSLFSWVASTDGIDVTPRPGSVSIAKARAKDGREVRIVHNWSFDPARVELPGKWLDVLAGGGVTALDLGPWDVRVLVREG